MNSGGFPRVQYKPLALGSQDQCAVIWLTLVLLSGAGEEKEKMVTVNSVFIEPKAKPTQDATKEFTPRVDAFTTRDWDHTRELPRQPVRTEVGVKLEHSLARHFLGFIY